MSQNCHKWHFFDATHDSFKKIIVTGNDIKPRRNENGIVTMGILDFLLNPNSLDY